MEKKKSYKTYLELFKSTFYISAFTFGGGYVIVPLIRKKFVEELKWIEEKEMIDLVALAQAAPGAIAVNTSILVGYKVAGVVGAMLTVLGTVLPPLIILSVLSLFYVAFKENAIVEVVLRGMQAGVAAIIIDVVWTMGESVVKEKNRMSLFVMIGAFIASYILKVNIVFIILACIGLGIIKTVYMTKKLGGKK